MTSGLPANFAQLEIFASWALPTEYERHNRRRGSTLREAQEFYNAMLPVLPVALDHLNKFDLKNLPTAERTLLCLCLALVEAAVAVEMFEEVNPPYLMTLDRFVPTHDRMPPHTQEREF
jgi:hypothetical protein